MVTVRYEAKIGTCDRLDISATAATALLTSNICFALYFCWINGYWLQVYAALHILVKKTGTCGPELRYTLSFIFLFDKLTDIGHKYMPHFIFWMRKQATT